METYPKPNVVISKCLGFEAVRYNAQVIEDPFVKQLQPFVNFIPVCPEVMINLGVPRMPIRIVKNKKNLELIQPATGKNVTKEMLKFSDNFLNGLKEIDGFILKYVSPTCGIGNVKIYVDGRPQQKGKGLFGGKVTEKFPGLAIEDEKRLQNYRIREHFLTKAFTLARLRQVKSMKDLVEFQTRHKFLFMAYDQNMLHSLGQIVGNPKNLPFDQVFESYKEVLFKVFQKEPKKTSWINVLLHMSGFFEKNERETLFFEESLGLYREGRIPLASLLVIVNAWAMRDQKEYVENQLVFHPYPSKLLELKDSGKVININ